MINAVMADECCYTPLNAAVLAGLVDEAQEWRCPQCNCLWKPREVDGCVRWWEPCAEVLILHRQRNL